MHKIKFVSILHWLIASCTWHFPCMVMKIQTHKPVTRSNVKTKNPALPKLLRDFVQFVLLNWEIWKRIVVQWLTYDCTRTAIFHYFQSCGNCAHFEWSKIFSTKNSLIQFVTMHELQRIVTLGNMLEIRIHENVLESYCKQSLVQEFLHLKSMYFAWI